MHLCNMLIYLLSLRVLNCVVLSVTTNTLRMLSLHISTYFACMWGQRTTLPSDCKVSAGPPRCGMFEGQSDRKPPKVTPQTDHGVVVAMPAFLTQCMWWIVTQLWVMMCTQSRYASKMIHKLASLFTYSQEAKKCQQNTAVSMCCHAYEACEKYLVQESVEHSLHNRLPWVWGSVEVSLLCAPQDHLELGIVMNWILNPWRQWSEPTAERYTFMVEVERLQLNATAK